MDTPLRLLLTYKIPDTLPGSEHYSSWNDLLLQSSIKTAKKIQQRFPEQRLSELSWGDMHKVHLQHPFSRGFPWLGFILDMPEQPLNGCTYCVRVASTNFGASMRLVASPGHQDNKILVTPTGQPFSTHYRDKYPYWINGIKMPQVSSSESSTLILKPEIN